MTLVGCDHSSPSRGGGMYSFGNVVESSLEWLESVTTVLLRFIVAVVARCAYMPCMEARFQFVYINRANLPCMEARLQLVYIHRRCNTELWRSQQ